MDTITVTNTGNIARRCGLHLLTPNIPVRVPLAFFMEYGQDRHLKYDFSSVPEALSARNEYGDLKVDWHSPLSMVDGYGRHAVWLIQALLREGVEVLIRDSPWTNEQYIPADIRALRGASYTRIPSKIGISFTLGYDPMISSHASLIKIGITQFETTHLPRVHVANINKCDHVIVTSQFGVKMFRDSGVYQPIDVMTPSVDTDYFEYVERVPDGKFKCLMVGGLTPRKNPLGAIRIFQEASNGRDDWKFTIKTRVAAGLKDIMEEAARDPRINVLVSDAHPNEIRDLYGSHDCLIWPSKGEGVGLPPLEAMATGMELVCADNSGMSDYLDKSHAYPIKTSHTESAHGHNLFTDEYVRAYGQVGEWWVPDEEHGIKQLRKCFDNWADGKGLGAKGAAYVREHHTLAHSARDIIRVAEQYV